MAQVTLTTDVKNFHIETPRAASASGTVPNKVTTTTLPTSTAGSVVFGTSLNYLKIKTLVETTANLTLFIYGWSFCSDRMAYVPQLLFSTTTNGAVTGTTAQASFPGIAVSVYETWQFTKSTGDAKIFNAPSVSTAGGFILIDTLGSQFVEVCAVSSSGTPNYYVMHSGV
jgi:hypothetical protein